MQSLGRVVRRFYATKPPLLPRTLAESALPLHAAKARDASTPMAVRERRQKKSPEFLPPPDSDLTPTEYSTYMRQLAKGQLRQRDGRQLTEAEWLDALNEKRSRVRGVKVQEKKTGGTETRVLGQKIYLPNIIFKMVRNYTPRGQPYNPYEATFRIPQSVTKTDVRSYLASAYGVKITYIRTANYISPLRRTRVGLRPVGSHRTYKRAVVGLVDPFYYPQDLEDMDNVERKQREKWLEERFALKAITRWRRYEMVRMSQSGSKSKYWRLTGHLRRDKILEAIARRRAITARDLEQVQMELADRRASGQPILREKHYWLVKQETDRIICRELAGQRLAKE
ncbi:hypothetical protein PAXINDRAFT_174149 [Paxillus involutus ATCC 200175]|nr:hypothetical protein PAXINDRAFT_174149 [Paxillus involutus ATCC 200175]